jgi:hypothetical protein
MATKIITLILIFISLVFYVVGMFWQGNDRVRLMCSVYGGWFCLFAVIEIALKVVFSL